MDRQTAHSTAMRPADCLRELFALDVTAAEIVCDGCSAVAEIGAVPRLWRLDGRDPALRAL